MTDATGVPLSRLPSVEASLLDLRRIAGRSAAVMCWVTGLVSDLDALTVPRDDRVRAVICATAGVAMLVGCLFWWAPWSRWRPAVLLSVVPVALVLLSVTNLVDPDPLATAP